MKPLPRAAVILSLASFACAAAASIATLAWSGAFPPAAPPPALNAALAEARGWSVATLATALPILLAGLLAARRGSERGRLAWLGALGYLVYTYLELAVSPPFTALFLPYVAAFAYAIPALALGVAEIDRPALAAAFDARVPRRSVALFALVVSGLLAAAWLKDIAARSFGGAFGWPVGEQLIRHVVQALDLGLQLPLGIATGVLLLRRRPGGYVVGGIWLVNAVCMGTALTAMVASGALAAGRGVAEAAPFAALPVIAVVLAVKFFGAIHAERGAPRPDPRAPGVPAPAAATS